MNHLLQHIGLAEYFAVSINTSGADIWDDTIISCEVSHFQDGKIRIVPLENCSDENFWPNLEKTIGDRPLVVESSLIADFIHAAFNRLHEIEDLASPYLVNPIWNLQRLSHTLLPGISFSSVSELEPVFGLTPDIPAPEKLSLIFYRLLEFLAQSDRRLLSQAERLLENSRSPMKVLFKKLTNYLDQAAEVAFVFPKLSIPDTPGNVIGTPDLPMISDTIQPVPDVEVASVFTQNGKLSRLLDPYEERPEQVELTLAINRAFNEGKFVLAEAGTGTGKSMAYLVPAIYWSRLNGAFGEQVVISTHTKNLQDQLFYKDIPLLQSALPFAFRAALLKGRGNYVCIQKWKEILSEPSSHLSPSERDEILPVLFWITRTRTGDIGECFGFSAEDNPALWNKLASESSYCQAQQCSRQEDCFVKKIREEARRSNVIVVNHALLFSDLVSDNAILGEYQNLILDEAHQTEKVAQNYLGVQFSVWSVKHLLSKLYERDRSETGALLKLKQKSTKSKLSPAEQQGYNALVGDATETCVNLWLATQALFQALTGHVLKSAGLERESEARKNYERKVRYEGSDNILQAQDDALNEWMDRSGILEEKLDAVIEAMRNWKSDVFDESDVMRELIILRQAELHAMRKTVQFLTDASNKDYVYWYELPAREKSFDMRFYAVPLNISEILKNTLFEKLKTCVFSSATLSVAGKFTYYKSRTGLDTLPAGRISEYSAGSPFDYGRQSRMIIPSFLPDPSHPDFNARCSEIIQKLILECRRGTLVLFTSYGMMNACYYAVRNALAAKGITIRMQGKDGSRTFLTEQFRSDRGSVLFGTDSFWEGVDVPGESLELLIMAKLPFEAPGDPLVAAKLERIDAAGGQGFFDYSVPEAVIKFRQGFGRLIRGKTDRGIVVALDNRLWTKAYGRYFLKSLPVAAERVSDDRQLLDKVNDFFSVHV